MRERIPSAEQAYGEHKWAARHLGEAKEKFERLQKIAQEQGFWDRAFMGKIKDSEYYQETEQAVQRRQKEYDDNIAQSRENSDVYMAEAVETMEQMKPYSEEQIRLAKEIGVDPMILETDGYIKSYDEALSGIHEDQKGDAGKIAGVNDFFKPRLEEPLSDGMIESRGNGRERLPRMDMGVDADTAVDNARAKGFTQILRIKQTTKMTSGDWRDINRTYQKVGSEKVYIPISDETANVLQSAGDMNEHLTLYDKGKIKDWPGMRGMLDFEFDVLSLDDLENEKTPPSIKLVYDKENFQTNESAPVEIQIEGDDAEDVHKKALQHLVGLEMGAEPVTAQNTRVIVNGQEMTWNEYEAELSQV